MDNPSFLPCSDSCIYGCGLSTGMDIPSQEIPKVISSRASHTMLTVYARSFAMAAAMFMNSNSLPIALMQSLVVTVHGLKWSKDDNKNAMLGRALTYLVLYSTLGMIVSTLITSLASCKPLRSFDGVTESGSWHKQMMKYC